MRIGLGVKMEIEVVGLGYVGLPLALRLAKKYQVVGVDKNQERIKKYSCRVMYCESEKI